MTLFTDQLSNLNLGSGYVGAYSLDNMPSIKGNGSFIVNADTSKFSGSHWLAICITPYSIYNIFIDPLGLHMFLLYPTISKYLSGSPIQQMPYPVQDIIDSSACGQFCAYILHKLPIYLYNLPLLVEKEFSDTDLNLNHNKVIAWYNKIQLN